MTYEEILSDANNLYRAYKASVKGSKWKETTQKFMMNFLRYIFSIQEDLLNRTLENGPVEEFSLSERGRVRPITSIRIRDRIVRHALCDEILLPEVKKHIIYDNGASIKGRGISHQRERFEVHLRRYYKQYGNEGWILFGDFSKFYDNEIPKEQLTGEKWMAKSVNIGDQLSQVIGIYYPYRIDNYVKYVRSEKFYGRYMDDWYIMNPSKEELLDLLDHIRAIAEELGIHINEKKTRIVKISSTYKFLQVKYTLTKDGKIIKRINPDRVTAMRRKLKKLAVKVENGEVLYENVENMFRGWMGSFYKILSRQQRQNLMRLYEDLFDKTVTVVNKKLVIFDRSPQNILQEV